MCQKYKDKRTKRFAEGERVREFQACERQDYKHLEILETSPNKEALMLLPRNRFEALGSDSSTPRVHNGQFSIHINEQWRICFEWPDEEKHPFNIEIVDYH
jgi:toxin HigB-1